MYGAGYNQYSQQMPPHAYGNRPPLPGAAPQQMAPHPIPPQIPPPGMDVMAAPLGQMDVVNGAMQYRAPHSAPVFTHPPPPPPGHVRFVDHRAPADQNNMVPHMRHSVPQMPAPTGSSTPVPNKQYNDFSSNELSFTGIGTTFDTPRQNKNAPSLNEQAINNNDAKGT